MEKKIYQMPEAYIEDLYEEEALLDASEAGSTGPQNGGNGDNWSKWGDDDD